MAFCTNCGKELNSNQAVCLDCGVAVRNTSSTVVDDNGGFLWGLLGFLVPLVGLVLWLIWRDERPNTARAVGIGALVQVGFQVVIVFIYIVFIIIFVATSGV